MQNGGEQGQGLSLGVTALGKDLQMRLERSRSEGEGRRGSCEEAGGLDGEGVPGQLCQMLLGGHMKALWEAYTIHLVDLPRN